MTEKADGMVRAISSAFLLEGAGDLPFGSVMQHAIHDSVGELL